MDAKELHPEMVKRLETLDAAGLHRRLEELKASAPAGDYQQMTDEALAECVMIAQMLRRKSSGPPKEVMKKRRGAIPDAEALA